MADYILDIMNQTSKLDWAFPFQRTEAFPLDRSSLFASLDDAKAYASGIASDERGLGGTSYIGQPISVYDVSTNTVALYIIDMDRNLKEVGSSQMGDNLSIEIANDKIQLKDFGIGYYAFVPAEVNEEGQIIKESSYVYTEGFKEGLIPKVISNDNYYYIGWYEPHENDSIDYSKDIQNLENKVNDFKDDIDIVEGKVALVNKEIDALSIKIDNNNKEIDIVKDLINTSEEEINNIEETINTLGEEINIIKEDIKVIDTIQESIIEQSNNINDLAENINSTKDDIDILTKSFDNVEVNINKVIEDINNLKENDITIAQDIQNIDKDIEDINANIEIVQEELLTKAAIKDVYTKSETEEEIKKAISNSDHLKRTIVAGLESIDLEAEDADLYIYMVSNIITGNYDEYMIVNGELEKVGDWTTDLSDYATKNELDNKVDKDNNARLITNEEADKLNNIKDLVKSLNSTDFILTNEGQLNLKDIGISKVINLQNQLNNKVNRIQTDGEDWTLLSPENQKKLAALTIEGDNIEISGSVNVDKVQGLSSWITGHRDSVDGLFSVLNKNKLNSIEENAQKNYITSVDKNQLSVDEGLLSIKSINKSQVIDLEEALGSKASKSEVVSISNYLNTITANHEERLAELENRTTWFEL